MRSARKHSGDNDIEDSMLVGLSASISFHYKGEFGGYTLPAFETRAVFGAVR